MKTIEEKAKAYDKVREKIALRFGSNVAEEIFSEFEMNEDERIRREIIEYIKIGTYHKDWLTWLEKQGEQKVSAVEFNAKDWYVSKVDGKIYNAKFMEKPHTNQTRKLGIEKAAMSATGIIEQEEWFIKGAEWADENPSYISSEKQGEQKPFNYENVNIQQKDFAPQEDVPRYNIGDVLCDKSYIKLSKDTQSNFKITDIRNGLYICDKCSFPISQQDEYELVAKKVEPKFKVGDWVVFNNKHQSIYQVEKIEDGYYILRHTHGGTFRVCVLHDESLRLWTIKKDAMDGDVLVSIYNQPFIYNGKYDDSFVGAYCGISSINEKFIVSQEKCRWTGRNGVKLATKEQRDFLFKKMKEAGYKWDAKKKDIY